METNDIDRGGGIGELLGIIEKLTDVQMAYRYRALEEKSLTFEQFEKLYKIREKREHVAERRRSYMITEILEIGTPVYATVGDYYKGRTTRKGTVYGYDKKTEHYIIETKTGKRIVARLQDVHARKSTDYSNVVISPEVKKLTTKELLGKLKWIRQRRFSGGGYCGGGGENSWKESEIRAELETREHVKRSSKDARKAKMKEKKYGPSK